MTIKSLSEQREKKNKGKDKRFAKTCAEELSVVLKALNLTIEALAHYKHHIPVMEVMSCIQTNRTLIEIQIKKYEKRAENEPN